MRLSFILILLLNLNLEAERLDPISPKIVQNGAFLSIKDFKLGASKGFHKIKANKFKQSTSNLNTARLLPDELQHLNKGYTTLPLSRENLERIGYDLFKGVKTSEDLNLFYVDKKGTYLKGVNEAQINKAINLARSSKSRQEFQDRFAGRVSQSTQPNQLAQTENLTQFDSKPSQFEPGTVNPGTINPGTVNPGTVNPGTINEKLKDRLNEFNPLPNRESEFVPGFDPGFLPGIDPEFLPGFDSEDQTDGFLDYLFKEEVIKRELKFPKLPDPKIRSKFIDDLNESKIQSDKDLHKRFNELSLLHRSVSLKIDDKHKGSGFIYSKDYVVTSYHVIDSYIGKNKNIKIILWSGVEKTGTIEYFNCDFDLAIIKFNEPPITYQDILNLDHKDLSTSIETLKQLPTSIETLKQKIKNGSSPQIRYDFNEYHPIFEKHSNPSSHYNSFIQKNLSSFENHKGYQTGKIREVTNDYIIFSNSSVVKGNSGGLVWDENQNPICIVQVKSVEKKQSWKKQGFASCIPFSKIKQVFNKRHSRDVSQCKDYTVLVSQAISFEKKIDKFTKENDTEDLSTCDKVKEYEALLKNHIKFETLAKDLNNLSKQLQTELTDTTRLYQSNIRESEYELEKIKIKYFKCLK